MEQILVNFSGKAKRTRFEGRDYLVAPLTLIVHGVLKGSKGSLYYPVEEIGRAPSLWNGMPIVVYHPVVGGEHISARDPDVISNQGIGVIYKARANGKLSAEAWFDVEKTRKVDERILNALEREEKLEISTGLFTTNEPAPEGSVHNGVPYDFIARNYQPDHLAILPDQVGACSVEDGCGVFNQGTGRLLGFTGEAKGHQHTVQLSPEGSGWTSDSEEHWHSITKFRVASTEGHSHSLDKDSLVDTGIHNKSNQNFNTGEPNMGTKQEDRKKIVDNLITNSCCWEENDRESLNKMSDEKLTVLDSQLKAEQETEAVVNAAREGFQDQQGNSHKFNTEAKKWESKIKEKEPVANQKGNPTPSEEDKPKTTEEWLEEAPDGVRSAVQNAMAIEQREKSGLANKLVANIKDDKTKATQHERLMKRSLADLQADVQLLPEPEKKPTANFAGAAAPIGNQEGDDLGNDFLPLPTINWGEDKKKTA